MASCHTELAISFFFILIKSFMLPPFAAIDSVLFSYLLKVLLSSGSSSDACSMIFSSFSSPTLFFNPSRIYLACFCTTDLFPLMLYDRSFKNFSETSVSLFFSNIRLIVLIANSLIFPLADLVRFINSSVTAGLEIDGILFMALIASFLRKPFSLTDFTKRMLIRGRIMPLWTLFKFWWVNS